MENEGLERDNLHYKVTEDDGYNLPINFILSPREPGKTTSILLDKVYSIYKKTGQPAVYLVNNAIDVNDALCSSFEESINEFKGYEIHLKFSKGSKETISTIYDKETNKPFIYIIPFSAPLTRLKRLNLGKISLMWYDECNVNVAIGEKWPKSIAIKWNELYTTLARKKYPEMFKFYATGNFYTRYNPLMVYLGVDCNALTIGKKYVKRQSRTIKGKSINYGTLVDCYQLKPELRDFILQHNPGYLFDDTYERYFKGEAIADSGLPLEPKKPENYKLAYVFKSNGRYLWVWKICVNNGFFSNYSYWCEVKNEGPGKRRDVWCVDLKDMMINTLFTKGFKGLFDSFSYAISKGSLQFQSPEAFYMIQEIYSVL